ncbi:MAG: hypothetical protein ACJAVK_001182 [Akkermansiaceae bacterium]|jgi:hypothetical protein
MLHCLRKSLLPLTLCSASFAEVSFNRDVLPILSDACFACHGPDSESREAKLRLDQEEDAKADRDGFPVIVPGQPDKSDLVYRIFNHDPDEVMPPPDSRHQLTATEKQTLRDWIKQGAKWEKHWAFVKPETPKLPTISNPAWPQNSIDHFILHTLDQKQLSPSPEASREKILRRVTLDLTGLPPTLEEVSAFLADKKPQAYERAVDRLLASPRYGETMALPWLEAARFADTDGYQYDGPRSMWRWRDWVIHAYNANKPFDQFTIEQLAGDLLPNATLDQQIATGFNRNHRYNSEAGLVVEEFLLENAVDRIDTTSTVWLGLTMGCARCHDHKYDPLSQKNYYEMLSFFNNIPEFGRAVKAGNSEPYILAPTKPQQNQLAALEAKVTTAQAAIAKLSLPAQLAAPISPLVTQGLNYQHPPGIIHFDGTKSLTIPNTPLTEKKNSPGRFEVFSPLSRFSVSLWVKPTDLNTGTIISRQSGDNALATGFSLQLHEGHLRYSIITRWIAGVAQVTTTEKLPLNAWTHLTLTFHGQLRATNQHIFINGKEATLKVLHNTNSNTGSAKKTAPLRLGGYPKDYFQGDLRDVRVYKRPLKTREILTLSGDAQAQSKTTFLEQGPAKDAYQILLAAEEKRDQFMRNLPTTMVMQENPTIKETFIRKRGVYNDLGEKVTRNVPTILPPFPKDLPRNRLGLARWLVSPVNPLTARVTVNRAWQKYFGTGLVKTSEDFGAQGEKPSHPELLDWLATEFMRSGWDVKHLQKLIVTSATYRQQSHLTPKLLEIDPTNRLLARGPRQRLPAHVIRDQALALSGLLVEKIGGPSVSPYQPKNLWIEMSMGTKYKQSQGEDLFRRSLYTLWKRTVNPPAMAILDAADREACWVGTKRTNTPLQALTLLNETAFVESARKLAERVLRENPDDPVTHAFKLVTQRDPQAHEKAILTKALAEYLANFKANPDSAKTLTAIGTSPVPDDLDPIFLAAHTTLANVLLNLDEVITKE